MLETRAKYPLYFYEKDDDGKPERISCEIPFNSTNKYHVMIRDMKENVEEAPERRNKMIIFKGAPAIEVRMPSDNVMAKPLIGPVPKTNSTTAAISSKKTNHPVW